MRVLVIGGGGREHAIVRTLSKSNQITALFCAPGNAGIAELAACVPIPANDIGGVIDFCTQNAIDFVVVAPDDPLALGMVDALEAVGIAAFGPRQNAAAIEASKVFSKGLMEKYGIPTARYRTFTDPGEAISYVRAQGAPIVVKADGLALGKGVVVAQSVDEAETAVREMMEDGRFGASGRQVVIEEFMTGPEVTVLCFADGTHILPMPSARDHKRAFDGNEGPNTGGMGAIAPVPDYTPELAARCMQEIFLPTMAAMRAEGRPFHGTLYFGLMLTPEGPKVVEYNARFGDPECQAILSLLNSDLMDILLACRAGTLDQVEVQWSPGAACCLVLASGGYPGTYQTGFPIHGVEEAEKIATVFHAGTKRDGDGTLRTNGGRVLGVTATGDTLDTAIDLAYRAAGCINFSFMHARQDIGRA